MFASLFYNLWFLLTWRAQGSEGETLDFIQLPDQEDPGMIRIMEEKDKEWEDEWSEIRNRLKVWSDPNTQQQMYDNLVPPVESLGLNMMSK